MTFWQGLLVSPFRGELGTYADRLCWMSMSPMKETSYDRG